MQNLDGFIGKTDFCLLELLKAELNSLAMCNTEDGYITNEIFEMAQKHSVTPLIYRSIKQLSGIPDDKIALLREIVINSSLRNDKLIRIQSEIIDLLSSHNTSCVILKGTSISALYPHNEMRSLGDIDILVGEEELDEACSVLLNSGFERSGGHDLHECFEGKGAYIEVHRAVSVFPDNAKGIYTKKFMEDALLHTETMSIGEEVFPVLDMPHQLVSLLSHMERHMTISGIGLRQLCDWAVTVNHYLDHIDDKCLTLLDACGLLRFAKVATRTCIDYLGLPALAWAMDVKQEVAAAFIEEILSSGDIMNVGLERSLSSSFASGEEKDSTKRTLLGRYIKNMNGKAHKEYPRIARLRVTLPLFWVFYPCRWWVRSLQGKREKVNVSGTLSIASKRKKLYSELKLFR